MRIRVFQVLLTLHISGLVIMAGTTFIDYVTFRTVGQLTKDRDKEAFLPLLSKYGALVRGGALILIGTGLGMLLSKGALYDQIWFKIKMALVVILILNGMFVGNPTGVKFRKMMADHGSELILQKATVSAQLNRFYISQLVLFAIIILVGVTKIDLPILK